MLLYARFTILWLPEVSVIPTMILAIIELGDYKLKDSYCNFSHIQWPPLKNALSSISTLCTFWKRYHEWLYDYLSQGSWWRMSLGITIRTIFVPSWLMELYLVSQSLTHSLSQSASQRQPAPASQPASLSVSQWKLQFSDTFFLFDANIGFRKIFSNIHHYWPWTFQGHMWPSWILLFLSYKSSTLQGIAVKGYKLMCHNYILNLDGGSLLHMISDLNPD